MTDTVSKNGNSRKIRFAPNVDNFEISLSYEGLVLKKWNERKTFTDLKRKYAR